MKLALTLLARDEEDILEANLDHHISMGADLIIVTDNGSVDRTGEILRAYESDGSVVRIDEPADDFSQAAWVTRMARAAARRGADWVINSDADEFWWPLDAPDLKATLHSVAETIGVVRVARHNFPPRPADGRPFAERMTLRDLDSRNSRGRPLPAKVAHRADPEVEVGMGNHRARGPLLGEEVECEAIEILHFPMRTYEQFEHKIIVGGAALAANESLRPGQGRTWRDLPELWRRGGLREFYEREVAAADAADPRYVEDTRLRDHLAAIGSPRRAVAAARPADEGSTRR